MYNTRYKIRSTDSEEHLLNTRTVRYRYCLIYVRCPVLKRYSGHLHHL
jgi:hypothetical protein